MEISSSKSSIFRGYVGYVRFQGGNFLMRGSGWQEIEQCGIMVFVHFLQRRKAEPVRLFKCCRSFVKDVVVDAFYRQVTKLQQNMLEPHNTTGSMLQITFLSLNMCQYQTQTLPF